MRNPPLHSLAHTARTGLLIALAGCACAAEPSVSPAPSLSVPGADGWLFLDKELRHLAAGKFWADPGGPPVAGDPLPAILDFKRQLDSVGVDLLVVPVPAKATIHPEALPPPGIPDPGATDREFFKVLGEQGVNVLDLTDSFRAARDGGRIYCQQDSHWAPDGIRLAAKAIADRVRDLPWVKAIPKVPLTYQVLPVSMTGDLAPPGAAPEPLDARFITADGQTVPPSKSSPIILLGDSHNLVFHAGGDMHAAGAGLPDQLAFELGFPVDVVAVRGSGATPARRNLARRKDNLAGRHLVVWCFSVREFTEGQGWSKVPVVRESAPPG
jgi:alginate O-acetyltransferase complex protein AlgJ